MYLQTDPQPVFRALSDPTRRTILEMLSQRAMPVGEIAAAFDVSRPAVAKHLRILEQSGLIATEQRGRERLNCLRPHALKNAADWIAFFDQFWDEKLAALKTIVEADNHQQDGGKTHGQSDSRTNDH